MHLSINQTIKYLTSLKFNFSCMYMHVYPRPHIHIYIKIWTFHHSYPNHKPFSWISLSIIHAWTFQESNKYQQIKISHIYLYTHIHTAMYTYTYASIFIFFENPFVISLKFVKNSKNKRNILQESRTRYIFF